MVKKKPPDITYDVNYKSNYKTIKVPLKKVFKKEYFKEIQNKIEDVAIRMNKFSMLGYEFIKLYLIYLYDNDIEFPKIDEAFIKKVFNLIGIGSKGGRKATIPADMQNFYNDVFSVIYPNKIDKLNLSYALAELSKQMIQCLETNIKTHFYKYIVRYVNIMVKWPKSKEIKKSYTSKAERKSHYQNLNKELKDIKSDIVNGKIKDSDQKYHVLIQDLLDNFPKTKKTYTYDVKCKPLNFLKISFTLNKKIEALEYKPYQVIPQCQGYIPKNFTLNTNAMIEILSPFIESWYNVTSTKMNNNSKTYQYMFWKKLLRNDSKVFKINNYIFYNEFKTDGFSANLLFIRKDYYDKTFGTKMPSIEEEEFQLIKLENLTKEIKDKFTKNKVLIGVDPGKDVLITMVDKSGKKYTYKNCRRRNDSYAKRSSEIILNERNKEKITEIETELSKFSKRTLSYEKYIGYINEKKNNTDKLEPFYHKMLFRKLAFRRFVRTKQSEATMLKEIEKKFGSNLLIGLGNWSINTTHQMKGCISSPTKTIGKILSQRFSVVEIDEFRTSKLYNKDLSIELTNFKVKQGKRRKKVHTLLTPTRNPNGVILNRDVNASKNILYILECLVQDKERPEELKR